MEKLKKILEETIAVADPEYLKDITPKDLSVHLMGVITEVCYYAESINQEIKSNVIFQDFLTSITSINDNLCDDCDLKEVSSSVRKIALATAKGLLSEEEYQTFELNVSF